MSLALGRMGLFLGSGRAGGGTPPPTLGLTYADLSTTYRYGVNLSGMQYFDSPSTRAAPQLDGAPMRPREIQWDYLNSIGVKSVRLPVSWEIMQRELFGDIGYDITGYSFNVGSPDRNTLQMLISQLDFAAARGMKCLVEIKNYGARRIYNGSAWVATGGYGKDGEFAIGSTEVSIAAYADFMGKFAAAIKDHPGVLGIDIMNEPVKMGTPETTDAHRATNSLVWVEAAQAAITTIRAAGFGHIIAVEGYSYANPYRWIDYNPTLHTLTDTLNNIVFSGHLYFDNNHSGTYTSAEATTPNDFDNTVARMITDTDQFKTWLTTYNKNGHIGEFNAPNTPIWQEVVRRFMLRLKPGGAVDMPFHLWGMWPIGFDGSTSATGNANVNDLNRVSTTWATGYATGEEMQAMKTLKAVIDPANTSENTVVYPVSAAPTLARTADGSTGQTYTATGTGPFQWVRRAALPSGAVTDIVGATASTYVAAVADEFSTLGVRNAGGTTYAYGPVLPAPILLDALDTTAGRPAPLGAGTTMALETTNKVQGAASIKHTIASGVALGGSDFTTAGSQDPATLGVITAAIDKLTEASNITGQQIFVSTSAGIGGNINLNTTQEANQLPGIRFVGFNSSQIATLNGAAANPIRVRVGMAKPTTGAADVVIDAVMARAGHQPMQIPIFDDGYKTIRTVAYPELSARGMVASVAPAMDFIDAGVAGGQPALPPADILFLRDAGWLIMVNATASDAAISTDPATAVAAANDNKARLAAIVGNDHPGLNYLVYPFGNPQNDAVATALVAAGYRICRGTQLPGFAHTRFGIGPSFQKKMPSSGVTSATTAASLLAILDQAILRGAGCNVNHMHDMAESGGTGNVTNSAVYTPLFDGWASRRDAGQIAVGTFHDLWLRDGGSSVPA